MSNKNLVKSMLIGATVFLVGCSEIVALPSNNSSALMNVTDLEKNIYEVVYEGLRNSGTLNNQVLDDVLYTIAKDKFGDYETVLMDVSKEDLKDKIQIRINEKLYGLISTGSYETRNRFFEERFANYVERQLYRLNVTEGQEPEFNEDFLFPAPSVRAIEDGSIVNEAINVEYYTDFIKGELVPAIYRELLVEEYVLNEDYSSLGRTYARKVNYIALRVSDNYPEAVKYLMDTFIDQYILADTPVGEADLEMLARAYKGVDLNDEEIDLLVDAGLLVGEGDNKTLRGELQDEYAKINIDPLLTDKAVESDFTGNGQYTPEKGLAIKEDTLSKRDLTTDGWYIKNGGLTSLPTAIRDRLFNIGVANALDRDSLLDEILDETFTGTSTQTNTFVRRLNGRYYLIPQTSQQGDERNFLWYDAGSKSYYLIEIEEAVNTTKMSQTSTANYDEIREEGFRELVASEIAKILATREGSKNSSTLHWLEEAALTFHDQAIFDFFKEQFPDLYNTDEDNAE
jgi:hypothetical protein